MLKLHDDSRHFVLAIVPCKALSGGSPWLRKSVYLIDSLNFAREQRPIAGELGCFRQDLMRTQLVLQTISDYLWDSEQYAEVFTKYRALVDRIQRNDFDCGLFTLEFLMRARRGLGAYLGQLGPFRADEWARLEEERLKQAREDAPGDVHDAPPTPGKPKLVEPRTARTPDSESFAVHRVSSRRSRVVGDEEEEEQCGGPAPLDQARVGRLRQGLAGFAGCEQGLAAGSEREWIERAREFRKEWWPEAGL